MALALRSLSPSQAVLRPSPSATNRGRVAIRRRRPLGRNPSTRRPRQSTAPMSSSRAYYRFVPHRPVSLGHHCSTVPFGLPVPGERAIRAHRRPRRSLAPRACLRQQRLDLKPRMCNRNSGHASGTRSEGQAFLKSRSALWTRCSLQALLERDSSGAHIKPPWASPDRVLSNRRIANGVLLNRTNVPTPIEYVCRVLGRQYGFCVPRRPGRTTSRPGQGNGQDGSVRHQS